MRTTRSDVASSPRSVWRCGIRRALRTSFWSLTLGLVVVAAMAASWVSNIAATLPAFPGLGDIPTSILVVDRDGKLLRPFTIADGRWRLPVRRSEVDPKFVTMLLGYEDRRFNSHG